MSKFYIVVAFLSITAGAPRLIADSCKADLSFVNPAFCVSDLNVSNGNQLPEVPLKYHWKISSGRFDLQFKSCLATKKSQNLPKNILIAIDRSSTLAVADSENFQKSSRTIEIAKKLIEQISADATARKEQINIGVMMFAGTDECKIYSGAAIEADHNFPCLHTSLKPTASASHMTYVKSFFNAADKKYAPQNELKGSDFSLIQEVLDSITIEGDEAAAVLLITDGKIYSGSPDEDFAYLRTKNYLSAQRDLVESFEKTFKAPMALSVALFGQTYNTYDSQFKSSYDNYCALNPNSEDCTSPVVVSKPTTWPVNGINVKQYIETLIMKTGNSSSALVAIDRLSNELAVSNVFAQLKASGEKLTAASIVKPNGERILSRLVDGQVVFKGLNVSESAHLDIQFGEPESEDPIVVPLGITFDQGGVDEDNSTPDEMVCLKSRKSKSENMLEKLTCGTMGTKKESNLGVGYFLYFLVLLLPISYTAIKTLSRRRRAALRRM